MAVQFWLRERRHDSRALVPAREGSHRFDVRATTDDAVCLRSRSRQARIPARTQVQVISTEMFRFVNTKKIIQESSKSKVLFFSETEKHTFTHT